MFAEIKNFLSKILIFQFIVLVIFIFAEFQNLQRQNFVITFKVGVNNVAGISDFNVPIDLKAILLVIAIVVGIIILMGIGVAGSGLSDISILKFAKFMSIVIFILLLNIPILYYLGSFQPIGLILTIAFNLIDLVYAFLEFGSEVN